MTGLEAFEDANHEGNSAKYHTGKQCVTKGCKAPAGTWWSPLWCFEHNVERVKKITASLEDAVRHAEVSAMINAATADLRSMLGNRLGVINAMIAASGGEITIQSADIKRETSYSSTSYDHANGTETWRVRLK